MVLLMDKISKFAELEITQNFLKSDLNESESKQKILSQSSEVKNCSHATMAIYLLESFKRFDGTLAEKFDLARNTKQMIEKIYIVEKKQYQSFFGKFRLAAHKALASCYGKNLVLETVATCRKEIHWIAKHIQERIATDNAEVIFIKKMNTFLEQIKQKVAEMHFVIGNLQQPESQGKGGMRKPTFAFEKFRKISEETLRNLQDYSLRSNEEQNEIKDLLKKRLDNYYDKLKRKKEHCDALIKNNIVAKEAYKKKIDQIISNFFRHESNES